MSAEKKRVGRKKTMRPSDAFEMRLMREAGVSVRECAGYFGVSEATAMRELAQLREKMGPEKFKRRGHLARAHLFNSQKPTL
jgi:predicted DNA-binding transcriptional regulator YafY